MLLFRREQALFHRFQMLKKLFLSERQITGGGRLACQAVIERDGVVKVLSRPEEVENAVQ